MVRKKLPVRWSPIAKQRLDNIYNYLAEDLVSAARYVKKSLVQLGGSLGHFPEKYSREYTLLMNQKTTGRYPSGGTRLFMR